MQDLCFIVSICKKCLQPVCYFPVKMQYRYFIVFLLPVYCDSEKVQQHECSTGIKVTAALRTVYD